MYVHLLRVDDVMCLVSSPLNLSVLHEGRRLRREKLPVLLPLHGVLLLQQLRRQRQPVRGAGRKRHTRVLTNVWHKYPKSTIV